MLVEYTVHNFMFTKRDVYKRLFQTNSSVIQLGINYK